MKVSMKLVGDKRDKYIWKLYIAGEDEDKDMLFAAVHVDMFHEMFGRETYVYLNNLITDNDCVVEFDFEFDENGFIGLSQ